MSPKSFYSVSKAKAEAAMCRLAQDSQKVSKVSLSIAEAATYHLLRSAESATYPCSFFETAQVRSIVGPIFW